MCDPVSALIATTALTAGTSIFSGMSANRTARANASAIDAQARARSEKADFDIAAADRDFRRQKGSNEAKIGTTGIDFQSFSDILADDAAESKLKKLAIRHNANLDVSNLNYSAESQRANGQNAMVAGVLNAATAVASGGSSYYRMSTLGARAGYGSTAGGGINID